MRCLLAFLLFCLITSRGAFPQDESRGEVFGGYSYLNIDTNGLSSRQSANGWEASVSGNFSKWFAVEGDVSGYYKADSVDLAALELGTLEVRVTDYSYGAGPRINVRPFFIHALFGGDHLTGNALGFSRSQDGLAGLAGGGGEWKVSGPWSVRASADYIFTRHNIFGGPSVTQNNYRASVGIVYRFGGKKYAIAPTEQNVERLSENAVFIPTLGISAIHGRSQGAQIIDESPTGTAALAGLHPGDVINELNGQPLTNPMELAAALSKLSGGEQIRLGYLIRGEWQSEIIVFLSKSH
jgi:PDZ domain